MPGLMMADNNSTWSDGVCPGCLHSTPWDYQTPPTTRAEVTAPTWRTSELKNKLSRVKARNTVLSTGPEVSAQIFTRQVEDVLWDATEMIDAIRDAKDLNDLKNALIGFIASLDDVVLSDADLLELAAVAVTWQGKSVKESTTMLSAMLDWVRRDAAFFGAPVSK